MDKQKLAVLARKNSSKWKGIDRESKREREGGSVPEQAGKRKLQRPTASKQINATEILQKQKHQQQTARTTTTRCGQRVNVC